ncbi:hypothetical protein H2201_007328 [Coniosporium apollinis]|uniref:Uncharacterized protein n=2 Tax=Coniosporium TaxID=2810619 RepID=A0ABQ9NJD1_9PEZI|nr:hypothetical protein H2199_006127 [Cladosporium sp. JES 115]KAJ9659579.1 hypothetical protein H2201_007328 [Coniosporium apollinis]
MGRGGGSSSGGGGGTTTGDSGSSAASNSTTSLSSILDQRFPATHFKYILPTAMFVVSAICVLCFIGFIVWYAWIRAKNNQTKKLLRWAVIGFSIFLMTLYFGLDVADRVLLELGEKRILMHWPFMITLEALSLFGDVMLMTFLLVPLARELSNHARIPEQSTSFTILCHIGLNYVLTGLAIASIAAFVYKLVTDQFFDEDFREAMAESGSKPMMILAAYTKLNVAFYGLYFAGAISITVIATRAFMRLRRASALRRTFLICLPLLCASVLVRTLGKFIYAIVFKLQARAQTSSTQLIHTILYGLLSVVIYATILVIAGSDDWESDIGPVGRNVEYGPVAFTSYGETQYKAEGVDVRVQETPLMGHVDQGYTYNHRN